MADLGTQLDIEPNERGYSLTGEIDAHTAPRLDEALTQRVTSGSASTRLEMAGVTFMDSSGLRVVIAATEACRGSGGELTLVGLTPAVERLVEISGLADHLAIESPSD